MKKTLVALAAMSAVASFAQSSVVLSGNIDLAAASTSGTVVNANASTFTMGRGTASTSSIKITATEDIGGGLKVFGMYELDPRPFDENRAIAHSVNTSSASGSTIAVASTLVALARGEVYVGMSGGFGMIKMGSPNTPGQDTVGGGSPLGTGVGSGYQINGGASTGIQSVYTVRYDRAFRYDSPNINGFTASVHYAPGNDVAPLTTTGTASTTAALTVPNNRQVTEIGLAFAKGPLKLNMVNIQQAKQTNATGWYPGNTATANYAATSVNIVSGSYTMGNITGYGTVWNGNGNSALSTANTASGYRAAVKASMGSVDLIGQYTEVKTNNGVETTSKITGARVDYNLSKTSAAYLGYETADNGAASLNQLNIVSLGLRKSF